MSNLKEEYLKGYTRAWDIQEKKIKTEVENNDKLSAIIVEQDKQIKELKDALIGMAELDIIITSKTESILNKARQALKE